MRSLILSQWRDLRIGVICEDLGALTTARAREFWICWSRLTVRKIMIERVTVVKFRMDNGGGNGAGCFGVELGEVGEYSEVYERDSSNILKVQRIRFGLRRKVFVKNKAEVASRVCCSERGERKVMYIRK